MSFVERSNIILCRSYAYDLREPCPLLEVLVVTVIAAIERLRVMSSKNKSVNQAFMVLIANFQVQTYMMVDLYKLNFKFEKLITVNPEYFVVKIFSLAHAFTKLNRTKYFLVLIIRT